MLAARNNRLKPEDWIKAAFRALAKDGIGAVKAESLARSLKTTKGSFYWHFKDVPALHRAMLQLWKKDATAAIAKFVDDNAPLGAPRLYLLMQVITTMHGDNEYGGVAAEPSIRDWARTDKNVAKAVCQTDAQRIAYLQKLFSEAGFGPQAAFTKAEHLYASFVGLQTLATTREGSFHNKIENLLKTLLKK